MKILVHTCCAPCANVYIGGLKSEGANCDLYWYNPNIHPFTEYRDRRDSLVKFAANREIELVMEDYYGLKGFIAATFEHLHKPGQRCRVCYGMRMAAAAREAKNRGYEAFSSTLLVSPYQDFEMLCEQGEALAEKNGIKFVVRDFRENFRKGLNEARAQGYYMQKYCGCVFSEEERYDN
ncbi:MAG: epoxyqueuosine reductase QueH [Clostridiales bacterium]|jgi:predicted adenine nucleotide alpha hydrolase (AANH) superfamily ATPase|nr:epoxyqueuosine reductase QueH [Clostridiales bacterium]